MARNHENAAQSAPSSDVERGQQIVGAVVEKGQQVAGAAKDAIRDNVVEPVRDAGKNIANSAREAGTHMVGAVQETGRNVASSAKEKIGGFRERIGLGIMKGMNWIHNTATKISSIPESMANFAYKTIGVSARVGENVVNKTNERAKELWQSAGEAKNEFIDSTSASYNKMADTVKMGAAAAQAKMAERGINSKYSAYFQSLTNELRLVQSGPRVQQERNQLIQAYSAAGDDIEARLAAGQKLTAYDLKLKDDVGNATAKFIDSRDKLRERRDRQLLRKNIRPSAPQEQLAPAA